jgi:hypothetical protein
VTSPVPTFTTAGITWETAMKNAGEILASLPEKPKFGPAPDWWSMRIAAAQAWIAFARELTMHTRASQ